MNKKNILIVSCIALFLVSFVTVTYSYFRIGATGNINANVGNILLTINGADSTLNEEFNVTLKRSETEEFIVPGDSGYFDINMNATGSIMGIRATVTLDRTGLPNNLKFFADEELTSEYVSNSYVINKADTMVKTVRIYWYWEDIDDENDSLFIDKQINAKLSVSAVLYTPTFAETLVAGATLDTNVNFASAPSSTNGQGLMMRDGTQDDEYPIVYYRGGEGDNNVIFADFCWFIVRTTETGGVKLLYNGSVNTDGSCNYANAGDLDNELVYFNNITSPVANGYMYQFTEDFFSFTSGVLDADGYKSHLLNNAIDQETGKHVQNSEDSLAKEKIDAWYAANIDGKPAESSIEDAVWCNDRSISDDAIENFNTKKNMYYSAYTRLSGTSIISPSLICPREIDKFTVNRENGNGDLTYPIGMLTADEVSLAGAGNSYFTGEVFWTLTSYNFLYDENDLSFLLNMYGSYLSAVVAQNSYASLRPAIVLSSNVKVAEGNGSYSDPYIFR